MINQYVLLTIFTFEFKNLIKILIELCDHFEEKIRNPGNKFDSDLKMKNILSIFPLNEIVFYLHYLLVLKYPLIWTTCICVQMFLCVIWSVIYKYFTDEGLFESERLGRELWFDNFNWKFSHWLYICFSLIRKFL